MPTAVVRAYFLGVAVETRQNAALMARHARFKISM